MRRGDFYYLSKAAAEADGPDYASFPQSFTTTVPGTYSVTSTPCTVHDVFIRQSGDNQATAMLYDARYPLDSPPPQPKLIISSPGGVGQMDGFTQSGLSFTNALTVHFTGSGSLVIRYTLD